jgi:hypothetical protein
MSGRLRQIALTVEETSLNSYTWVLIESAAGRVVVLEKAEQPQATYMGALTAGYERLAQLSANGMHEDEDASDRGAQHSKAQQQYESELNDAI